LIEAFKATLEDTLQADLLLHVVDASSSTRREQMDEVHAVLREIGADAIPQFLIFNKTDLLPADLRVTHGHNAPEAAPGRANMRHFAVSALTGTGIDVLRDALRDAALADPRFRTAPPDLSDSTQLFA